MNSLSSGERNEKSPYTKVSEQCLGSLDLRFRAGGRFGPIMNNLLCMVPRRFVESGCLRPQPKAGGKSPLRLNIYMRQIANKYRVEKVEKNPEERARESSTKRETVDRQTDRTDGENQSTVFTIWKNRSA
ncbi:Elongation factor G [Trichinella pseudospiralis]